MLDILSPDGKVLQIIGAPFDTLRAGDVVSILSGPGAGLWRRVLQALTPTTVLVDEPIPSGAESISISPGYVNERFEGNRIDLRGGRCAIASCWPAIISAPGWLTTTCWAAAWPSGSCPAPPSLP